MGVNYEKLQEHLKDYTIGMDPIPAIRRFVLGYLDPKPENYMDYRYEHMLRVALWGKRIAEGEGWDPEPLIIGGLLHDVRARCLRIRSGGKRLRGRLRGRGVGRRPLHLLYGKKFLAQKK